MPEFLEDKLKREYGRDSKVPFKVMNAIGAMHGNKETAKGKAMEKKHEEKAEGKSEAKGALREMRIEVHRGADGKVTGHTVHHEYERPKQKSSSPAFYEERPKASHPFGAGEHEAMIDHIDEHLDDSE